MIVAKYISGRPHAIRNLFRNCPGTMHEDKFTQGGMCPFRVLGIQKYMTASNISPQVQTPHILFSTLIANSHISNLKHNQSDSTKSSLSATVQSFIGDYTQVGQPLTRSTSRPHLHIALSLARAYLSSIPSSTVS